MTFRRQREVIKQTNKGKLSVLSSYSDMFYFENLPASLCRCSTRLVGSQTSPRTVQSGQTDIMMVENVFLSLVFQSEQDGLREAGKGTGQEVCPDIERRAGPLIPPEQPELTEDTNRRQAAPEGPLQQESSFEYYHTITQVASEPFFFFFFFFF